jgi:ABC-type phosphate/phosphonate transport system permease subunit
VRSLKYWIPLKKNSQINYRHSGLDVIIRVLAEHFAPVESSKETLSNSQEEASLSMTSLAMNLVEYFQDNRDATWETIVRVVFGTFVGALIVLLILLYAGVPIV